MQANLYSGWESLGILTVGTSSTLEGLEGGGDDSTTLRLLSPPNRFFPVINIYTY